MFLKYLGGGVWGGGLGEGHLKLRYVGQLHRNSFANDVFVILPFLKLNF
jgi:hypothetical protein